jgi:hypothetical protein
LLRDFKHLFAHVPIAVDVRRLAFRATTRGRTARGCEGEDIARRVRESDYIPEEALETANEYVDQSRLPRRRGRSAARTAARRNRP